MNKRNIDGFRYWLSVKKNKLHHLSKSDSKEHYPQLMKNNLSVRQLSSPSGSLSPVFNGGVTSPVGGTLNLKDPSSTYSARQNMSVKPSTTGSNSASHDISRHSAITPVRSIPRPNIPRSTSTSGGQSSNRKSGGQNQVTPDRSTSTSSDTSEQSLHPKVNRALQDADTAIDDVNDIMDKYLNPEDIVKKIPAIATHRFVVSLLKYPGIADIVMGAFVLFATKHITDLMEALSIVSISSGVYVFLMWLYTHLNHHKSMKDVKSNMQAKIVHLIGGIILLAGHVALAILAFLELKDLGELPSGTTIYYRSSTSAMSTSTTGSANMKGAGVTTSTLLSSSVLSTTSGDPDRPLLSYNALLGIEGGLCGIALLMLLMQLVATAYAVYAHRMCKLQLKCDQELLDEIRNGEFTSRRF